MLHAVRADSEGWQLAGVLQLIVGSGWLAVDAILPASNEISTSTLAAAVDS